MGEEKERQHVGKSVHFPVLRGLLPGKDETGLRTRLGVLILLLVFPLALLLGISGTALADNESDENSQTSQDPEIDGLSFYRLSSSMTALFSTAQEPGSNVGLGVDDTTWEALLQNPASAGSMLGYPDENYNPIMGWLDSRIAQSSNSVGYSSLVGSTDSGVSGEKGARDYALYGATLNGLGLDGTSTGLSLGFFSWLAGGLILILFAIAAAVDALWSIILKTLIWINPFRLIYDAVNALSGPTYADGMTAGEGAPNLPGPLDTVVTWINIIYSHLIQASWNYIIPVFVGAFFISILLFKGMNKGSALKKLLLRMFFIVLGIPLLGSMYSGVLNVMSEAADQENSAAAQVVLSTYVDFEGWAMDQRLRVPKSDDAIIEWSMEQNAPSGESQSSVTNLALLINSEVIGLSSDAVQLTGEDSWDQSMLAEDGNELEESHYSAVMDILLRYMNGSHVNASSFESEAKSTLTAGTSPQARVWFQEYIGDPETTQEKEDASQNPLLSVRSGTGLASEEREGGRLLFSTSQGTQDCGLELAEDDEDGSPKACNLAPLAMYNYLNTDFGPTSYTAYSSGKTSSEATRSIHNSVNLVGTGVMSFVYWINAVVLLGAFVFIGVGYAVALVIANLRRTFQLITAIPFAVVGVVSGIAKVIVYTVAMLMEILITMFMYKLVQSFLLAIPGLITAPFAEAIGDNSGQSNLLSFLSHSGFLHMVITLLSITVVILFTIMAMRLRKTLVKAVEDTTTKLVEKFTDPKAPAAGGNSMKPGRPGGGGKGVESASGNRKMGGASGPKNPRGASAGGTNSGGGLDGMSSSSADSSETRVSGDVDTDGKLEGPGETSDEERSGSGLEPSAQERDAAGETELGRRVENDGLSDDPLETMAGSVRQSAADYAESDKHRLGAATDGVKATGHAAVAVGRGVAGDGVGAAESAGKAAEKGGSAMAGNARANQASERAGKSALDNPAPSARHQRQIQQGQQIQQAGSTVSNVAGMAGSTGGGSAPKGPQAQPIPKKSPTGSTGSESAAAATRRARSQRQGPKPPSQPKPPKRK